MKALAQLCCLVLMLLGLGFIGFDIFAAWIGDSGSPMYDLGRHRCLWQWGIMAISAGVFGTALLSIAEALAHRGGPPSAAKPEPKPE